MHNLTGSSAQQTKNQIKGKKRSASSQPELRLAERSKKRKTSHTPAGTANKRAQSSAAAPAERNGAGFPMEEGSKNYYACQNKYLMLYKHN